MNMLIHLSLFKFTLVSKANNVSIVLMTFFEEILNAIHQGQNGLRFSS